MVYNWINRAHRALFPSICLLCGRPGAGDRDLCAGCFDDLPFNRPACARCAAPLPTRSPAEPLCGRCLRHPPHFDRMFALCRYESPADYLLRGLKFGGRLAHARLLGELLAGAIAERAGPLPECILPVPLHRWRLWRRGFNQALELARPIAGRFDLPLDVTTCTRVRATRAQSTLPAARRRANVRGAFRIDRALHARHIAIVDDVVTTAHTVDELARVLRQAGARHIEVWAWARA